MFGLDYPFPFLEVWWTIIFLQGWYVLYLYLEGEEEVDFSADVTSRIITSFHALFATIISGYALKYGPDPFLDIGETNTFLQEWALINSLSYFIFDLIYCLILQCGGYPIRVHHIASIVIIGRILIKGYGGAEAVAAIFYMEISQPLFQYLRFAEAYEHKKKLYHLCYVAGEIIFISLYAVFRLGYGTVLFFCVVNHPNSDLESKLSALSVYFLAWFVMSFIARLYNRKYILPCEESAVLPVKNINANLPTGASASDPIISSTPSTSGINTKAYVSVPNTSVTKDKML